MTTTLDPGSAALVGGVLGTILGANIVLVSILGLAIAVLLIIAQWKIFTKAGEKGWKSLIPIYNGYIMFKLFWETKWFWIELCAGLVAGIFSTIMQDNLILILLELAAAIMALIISIMLYDRMSKSFGHGAGYTIGLVFLPNIFLLILGFNKDKYKKIKG